MVGVLWARRRDGCRVDTGGRKAAVAVALLLVLLVPVLLVLLVMLVVWASACDGRCGLVCEGPCSPSVKKEGREADEDG